MSDSTIRDVTVIPVDIPLDEPFVIATGARHAIENVVVRLELEGGGSGLGESSPLEPINGESRATVVATLEALRPLLVGRDVHDVEAVSADMKAVYWAQCTARAAVEIALLDAAARLRGQSVWEWFGAAESALETDYTISICAAEDAERNARRLWDDGFRKLKTKVGRDFDGDLDRLRAIRRAAPDAEIQLDANGGFEPDEAIELIAALRAHDIRPTLLEQPVAKHDLAGMRRVREAVDMPVAADESVFFLTDARRVIDEEAADVINIKLMKSGPVEGARIHALCRERGTRLMVGCMLESRVGMTAAVHFAAGLGGFEFVDLDPHGGDADPFTGGPAFEAPYHRLVPAPDGLGVRPR